MSPGGRTIPSWCSLPICLSVIGQNPTIPVADDGSCRWFLLPPRCWQLGQGSGGSTATTHHRRGRADCISSRGGAKGFRRGGRPSQPEAGAHMVQPSEAPSRGNAKGASSELPRRVSTVEGLLVAARKGLGCLKGWVLFWVLTENR